MTLESFTRLIPHLDFTANLTHFQHLVDARQVHVDARSLYVTMLDPQITAQATEAVASSRVQAAQEVAQVVTQATQAVAEARETSNNAQLHAHHVTAEAQAHIGALQTELQRALERERQLQQRLQEQGNDINTLHSNMLTLANSPQNIPQEAANGTGLNSRVQSLENQVQAIHQALQSEAGLFKSIGERLDRIEGNLATQQEHLQEMWMNGLPSQVEAPYKSGEVDHVSPVHFRMDSDIHEHPAVELPIPSRQDHANLETNLLGRRGGDRTPSGTASNVEEDVERQCLRTKDLHHLKIPQLPETASHFRTWRNSLRTSILAYDQSVDGKLATWLSDAFTLRGDQALNLAINSGDFPRMDRILASLICKPESMRTPFGLRIQAYVEQAEATGAQIRGRFLLNMVAQEFDVGPSASAINNALELFQLQPPAEGVGALKVWRDRATYILCQIPQAERPQESLLSQWAYQSLKKNPLMRRAIDRYKEANPGTVERSFQFLWDSVLKVLQESQHDANAMSIRNDLHKGPGSKRDRAAAAAAKSEGKGKGDKLKEDPAKGKKGKGKGDKPGNKPGKGETSKDGKGKNAKGNKGGETNKKSSMSNEDKARTPCLYHAQGKCMRGAECPFSHAAHAAPASSEVPTQAPKAAAKPAAKVAAGLVAVAIALSSLTGADSHHLDWVGDTGAGERLGSREALRLQGYDLPLEYETCTARPLRFTTGGGEKKGSTTVECQSWETQTSQQVYLLPNCPLAVSIGQLVSQGFSFCWPAGQLPCLIPPHVPCTLHYDVDSCIQAHRIDHHVPIFRFSTEFSYGMPAHLSPRGGMITDRNMLNPSQKTCKVAKRNQA